MPTDSSPDDASLTAKASALLARLAGPDARLRDDQLAAVSALVRGRQRVLLVQRTGWGKSAVYFIATRLIRTASGGPTLLVSPLLALMRDQIAAAERIGVRAETINSTNVGDWEDVTTRLLAGDVDLLLISPERLNNPAFRDQVLPRLAGGVGLVVVDEAHCVSDWGHDFRPDYRRIVTLLGQLPVGTPVLATTATANDRVITDVAAQLGAQPLTLRGRLDRASLRLAVHRLPGPAARLAWLSEWIPAQQGSGIVYCLTVAETQRVAEWLRATGIAATAYSGDTDPVERERVEAALKENRLKAVVATTALGMGYDKPDLGFVVHLGMPPSPIAYYQAIGRAGRAVERAEVVLLPGEADEAIWAYFDTTAFPPQSQVTQVLDALTARDRPASAAALEAEVNLSRSRLEGTLKILDVDGAVTRVEAGWQATGRAWHYDRERLEGVAATRRAEQDAMRRYATTDTCLMAFLQSQLDDPAARPCGICANCAGPPGHLRTAGTRHAEAQRFLRGLVTPLPPRRRWPAGLDARRGNIAAGRRAETGRALAEGVGGGWDAVMGRLLAADFDAGRDRQALDEAVAGLVKVLAGWDWPRRPEWICPLPSRRRQQVVDAVAARLGTAGRLPVVAALGAGDAHRPFQADLANSTHRARNALAGLRVAADVPAGPVLVIDDTTRSGWTLTVAADLLGAAGARPVLPLVLRRDN